MNERKIKRRRQKDSGLERTNVPVVGVCASDGERRRGNRSGSRKKMDEEGQRKPLADDDYADDDDDDAKRAVALLFTVRACVRGKWKVDSPSHGCRNREQLQWLELELAAVWATRHTYKHYAHTHACTR